MAVTIGSNISSLRAQRSLNSVSEGLSKVSERLASGSRINRASDDAAGLSVSATLNANSRLYATASRNINDGLSLLNIVDSTLSSQSEMLGRMMELAEQSANGTYSTAQRNNIQVEYLALQREFARLADTTSFNGLKPLRGSRSDGVSLISLQAGINGSSTSILSVRSGDTSNLSGTFNLRSMGGRDGMTNLDGQINLGEIDAIPTSNPASTFNSVFYTQVTGSDGRNYDVAIAAVDYSDDGNFGSDYNHTGQVAVSFAAYYKKTDGTWGLMGGISGAQLGGGNDFSVTFDESSGHAVSNSISASTALSTSVSMGSATGTLSLDFSDLKFFVNGDESQPSAIDLSGVENQNRSRESLMTLKNRMDELSSMRGSIGATMSRLMVANQLAMASRENSIAAASRITDTDVATDAAELTRKTILQQVATSVLAQANQTPALALRLLQV